MRIAPTNRPFLLSLLCIAGLHHLGLSATVKLSGYRLPESIVGICKGRFVSTECQEAMLYVQEQLLPVYVKDFASKAKTTNSSFVPRYSLDAAGAGVPKSVRIPTLVPLEQVKTIGNDALYADRIKFVISDGVGCEKSAQFLAVELIRLACLLLDVIGGRELDIITIKEMLGIVQKIVSTMWLPGSATLSLGIIDEQLGKLWMTSIGDSAIRVYREGKEIANSLPPPGLTKVAHYVNAWTDISERQVQISVVNLKADDIIIAATNGLWDNVRPSVIKNMLMVPSMSAEFIAQNLVKRAAIMARQTGSNCELSQAEDVANYYGAKLDDIAVAVSRVVEMAKTAE